MQKRLFISFFLISLSISAFSQYKFGIQAASSINFQTVNSLFRNFFTLQSEYRGAGRAYNRGICFSTAAIFEVKINENLNTNILLEYMPKKVRVFYDVYNVDNYYMFDLNYHYIRLPIALKVKKSKSFYYDFGLVNNFLLKYDKQKLYTTMHTKDNKGANRYNAGLMAGFGFTLFKKYAIFVRGETDISPFYFNTEYDGNDFYPFKFHNITLGARYWFF